MSQNVLSQKMVNWPVGLPTVEEIANAGAVVSAYARNKKSIIDIKDMDADGTLNLATTYVAADQDGITRNIVRENGFELVIKLLGDGAHTLTLGTGFGTVASIASTAAVQVFKFEYIDGAYELVA